MVQKKNKKNITSVHKKKKLNKSYNLQFDNHKFKKIKIKKKKKIKINNLLNFIKN